MANANIIKFCTGTFAQYTAISSKDANTLYFISDLGLIYKGDKLYGQSVEFVSAKPAAADAKAGVLYVDAAAQVAYVKNGSNIVTIGRVVETTISTTSTDKDGEVASIGAIKAFVNGQVASGFIPKIDPATAGDLVKVKADGTLEDAGVVFGGATLSETPSDKTAASEAAVSTAIAAASSALHAADVTLQSNIDAVSSNVTAVSSTLNAKIDTVSSALNADIEAVSSAKLDKFTGVNGQIVVVDASGNAVKDSGFSFGGAAIAAEPVSTVVASEKAVYDYVNAKCASVFRYKGIKATHSALPTTGNEVGDVWIVTNDEVTGETNVEYVWTEDGGVGKWEKLGPTMDLSAYATKEDLAAASSALNEADITLQSNIDAASSTLDAAIETASSALNDAKINKVSGAVANDAVKLAADGSLVDAGYTFGGAALDETPVATKLATEKAVADADTAVSTALNTKITNASSALNASITAVSSALNAADAVLQSNIDALETVFETGSAALDTKITNASSALNDNITAVSSALHAADVTLQTNIDGKLDKFSGTNGHIVLVDSTGNAVKDGGVTVGGATLSDGAPSTVLATEAAVKTAISTKMDYVSATAAGQVLIASATGNSEASGYTLGGTTLNPLDPSTNTNVARESAVINALAWQTL